MKIIDVYTKMTNFEIEIGTKLIIGDYTFCYVKRWLSETSVSYRSETSVSYRFEDEKEKTLEDYYDIDLDFLNKEVELIPPKPKKYLIKVNVHGLREDFAYLNYFEEKNQIMIYEKDTYGIYKTQFTEKEMQSIKPIKEFLDDMQGKYELIKVEDDEIN